MAVNPFIYGCIVEGEHYCPRARLQKRLAVRQADDLLQRLIGQIEPAALKLASQKPFPVVEVIGRYFQDCSRLIESGPFVGEQPPHVVADAPAETERNLAQRLNLAPQNSQNLVRILHGRCVLKFVQDDDHFPLAAAQRSPQPCNLGHGFRRLFLADALRQVFADERKGYEQIVADVSAQQLAVLRTIARLGGASIQSADFLASAGITHASSAKSAATRLVRRRILYETPHELKFSNPFFRAWLVHVRY